MFLCQSPKNQQLIWWPLIIRGAHHANKKSLPRLFRSELCKMENIASNDYLDSLDDPVTLFDREIRRMLKSPSASHSDLDRQLQSVLRRCIDYIQQQQRYRNDPRYLRIWLMYASYYRDPLHVLDYLERAEIGRYLSAFYENYASLLERSGRYSITPLEQNSAHSTVRVANIVMFFAMPRHIDL